MNQPCNERIVNLNILQKDPEDILLLLSSSCDTCIHRHKVELIALCEEYYHPIPSFKQSITTQNKEILEGIILMKE